VVGSVGGWPTLSRRLGIEVELAGARPFAILNKEWAAWAVAATTIVLHFALAHLHIVASNVTKHP
jgi:hypothetical protein